MKNKTGTICGFVLGLAGFLLMSKFLFLDNPPPADELAPGIVVIAAILNGLVFAFVGQRIQKSVGKSGTAKRFAQVLTFLLFQLIVLFLGAGKFTWIWAWVYLGICIGSMIVNGVILLRSSPETIAERGQATFTRNWDKTIAVLYSLFLFLLVPLAAALDIRFVWTGEIENTWHIVGAMCLIAGFALSGWAMIVNAFFSTVVRIQTDRGQTVCRNGPYRFVRHPGYVGFILQALATPVLLGSVWGLVPGAAAAVTLIVRTSLEDRTLRNELPGYGDYVREVRSRLIPGVW
jgi:protein-S-isoprenylcysteine O-methyltransferase Ste14